FEFSIWCGSGLKPLAVRLIDAQTENFRRNVLHGQDIALRCLLEESSVSGERRKCTPGCQRSRTAGPTTVRSQRMSHLANALRAATAAAMMGSFGCLGGATATADPNTGSSSDVNTLAGNLSKGYGLNNCTAEPITGNQLAALTCGQSPDPGGPVQAKYFLFSSGDDLNSWFKNSIKDDVLTNCGDSSTQGPAPWHQGSNATTNAGQVACGTYQ